MYEFSRYDCSTNGESPTWHRASASTRANSTCLSWIALPEYIFEKGSGEKRLESYTKVIVVRHPFDRLRSTHNNKFVETFRGVYPQMYRRKINASIHENVTKSLEQFLTAVKERYHSGYYNRHWMSYVDLCHPCHIQYDYILKMETLTSDLVNVLPVFNNFEQEQIDFPESNRHQAIASRVEETSHIFQNLSLDLVNGLLKINQDDFELFGYQWDNEGAPCATGVNASCC